MAYALGVDVFLGWVSVLVEGKGGKGGRKGGAYTPYQRGIV